MKKKIWSGKNEDGIPFNAVLVKEGDHYGLDDCLVHDEREPLVEFYDARYKHTKFGQFVSRYYLSTFLKSNAHAGLNLQGGEPDWVISRENKLAVRRALRKGVAR